MSDTNLPVPVEPAEGTAMAPSIWGTNNPSEVVQRAVKTADVLAGVLRSKHLTKRIGQKEHVLVEGWTMLGSMLGVFPVCVWTKPLEDGGWEARVEARTASGAVVGAAEASCTRSEATWSKRDDYALRSMAQTRATSKALRQPLGFVVVLAGYDATPEEEMPRNDTATEPRKASSSPATASEPVTQPVAREEVHTGTGEVREVQPVVPSKSKALNYIRGRLDEAFPYPDPEKRHLLSALALGVIRDLTGYGNWKSITNLEPPDLAQLCRLIPVTDPISGEAGTTSRLLRAIELRKAGYRRRDDIDPSLYPPLDDARIDEACMRKAAEEPETTEEPLPF